MYQSREPIQNIRLRISLLKLSFHVSRKKWDNQFTQCRHINSMDWQVLLEISSCCRLYSCLSLFPRQRISRKCWGSALHPAFPSAYLCPENRACGSTQPAGSVLSFCALSDNFGGTEVMDTVVIIFFSSIYFHYPICCHYHAFDSVF